MGAKRYNVEYNSAETGEDTEHTWLTFSQVETLLLKSKEGDDIVVHCLGSQP